MHACTNVSVCLSLCLCDEHETYFQIEKISHGFHFISFYFFGCIPPHLLSLFLSDYHPKNFCKHIIHIISAILLTAWRHFFDFVSQFSGKQKKKTEMIKRKIGFMFGSCSSPAEAWRSSLTPRLRFKCTQNTPSHSHSHRHRHRHSCSHKAKEESRWSKIPLMRNSTSTAHRQKRPLPLSKEGCVNAISTTWCSSNSLIQFYVYAFEFVQMHLCFTHSPSLSLSFGFKHTRHVAKFCFFALRTSIYLDIITKIVSVHWP